MTQTRRSTSAGVLHAPASPPHLRRGSLMRQRTIWAYVFVAAPLVGLLVFFLGPIVFSGWVSLHDWNMITPVADMAWAGLDNYIYLLTQDTVFPKALLNTFLFAIGGVGSNVVLGLGFALLLNGKIRGKTLWRVIYFLPVMTAPLALGVIFGFMFNRNYGVVNNLLVALSIPRQPFLGHPSQALLVVIIIAVYQYVGYYIVIYLAGLQGIPQDYYDAASVDGANKWQSFRHITLPLLRPVTLFVVVTNTIGALQVFDLVFATTNGGPANSTITVVLHMYNTAFKFSRMGRASAMAFILFAIILTITILQLRFLRDRTNE
ncbi:MAG: sugar ABC transporter permease [Chloroflexi bacterium]|nr:sugar ABC transporter permease [Chloroflexota bacterium]